MTKHGFRSVLVRNLDIFTAVDIRDLPFGDGVGDCFANLAAEALQEPLSIDGTFVFRVEAAVYKLAHDD